MRKNYILFLAAVSFFKFSTAQTLSTAPTLTFTNNTGISTDNIASDGDGGSVNISDIDIQIYNISDINGTFQNQLSWENNTFLNSSNASFSGITRNDGGPSVGTKGMLIKSVSGSEFKLNQFVYYNWGETTSTIITVKGYKNTTEVATTSFQAYDGGAFLPMTIILNAAFNDVDEVRFYISAGGYASDQSHTNHSINSIQVSTPVLSSNSFELDSKLNAYPNPASNQVNIELLTNEIATLEVYDVSGKFLFTEILNTKINTINIEKLTSGIYFFKVSSSEGISTKKITKN
ncbi:T9SS type A sorting domain-containing protein [Flavobacterium facile]|uniref:T9SS type A sorting domain-containing protein n=1 Tax=Flavobacterium facile TaxID=2893174 RepID=UPI002E7A2DA1|nr:T9SS type A sorting domain-containing protein [Flavobacterium sp. T-12]